MWYLGLPHYKVIERVNWTYFCDCEPIYRQDFRFTLREHWNCSHQNARLVILVTSHPSDVKARQAVRAEREDKVLALSFEDEHLLYGNIIQDFLDTYNNLTLKTIMAFKWVTEFCPNAGYITKTDTDVFINTGNLGHPFKVSPPYCSGLGYIIYRNLVPRIYEMTSHVKPINFEDVYVGICLNLLKVDIHIPEDTNLFFLYRIHLNVCQSRCMIAAHGFSSKEIITFWQAMLRNTTCHFFPLY
ncbi:hypothetical protein E2I00_018346, partial [Balaenoptera physalus]